MKKLFSNSMIASVSIFALLLLVSCSKDKLIIDEGDANKKAVGSWHLTEVNSGWISKTPLPAEKIELAIDKKQQGIIYVDGAELLRFEYRLEETTSNDLVYTVIQQSVKSKFFYIPEKGFFKLNARKLIIGDYLVADGIEYTFNR